MKTGNEILDKALQAQKGAGEIELVKASFYESPISYGELVNNTVYSLINYTYINLLLKDIEATYNNWNKAIGILEKIVDFSKDYCQQKLDGLKEQMYWLNDHGKQARGLDGMIKDAIIFKTGNYEDSPGAQYRIDQVYNRYNQSYKSTVGKIEKGFLDIIYGNKPKDTRPLIEKLKPVINQLQPEQATLFTNGIKTHVKPEINLIGLEINILMQQPSNILQSYFIEPNDEEQKMIEELKAEIEKMKNELQNKNNDLLSKNQALEDKDKALEDKDRIILEQKEIISKTTNESEEQKTISIKLQETNNNLTNEITAKDEEIQTLKETNSYQKNQIDNLNTTIESLKQSNVDQNPKIRELEHKLEIAAIEKKSLEKEVTLYNKEIINLERDKADLREDKYILIEEKKALNIKTNNLEQTKEKLTEEKQVLLDNTVALTKHINSLSTEIESKNHNLLTWKTHCTEYETVMLGCEICKDHVFTIID